MLSQGWQDCWLEMVARGGDQRRQLFAQLAEASTAMEGGAMLNMYKNGEVNRQEFEAACGGMKGRISDEACQAELQCKEFREQLGLWEALTFNFEQCEYVCGPYKSRVDRVY